MKSQRAVSGYRNEFTVVTKGEGILSSRFIGFRPHVGEISRHNFGSMISMTWGYAVAFALWNLEERGTKYIEPGEEVYEGMIIGNVTRGDDLDVNPLKAKELSNMRSKGSNQAIMLAVPWPLNIERGLEIMKSDEDLEITPKNVRLRKKYLTKIERSRVQKKKTRMTNNEKFFSRICVELFKYFFQVLQQLVQGNCFLRAIGHTTNDSRVFHRFFLTHYYGVGNFQIFSNLELGRKFLAGKRLISRNFRFTEHLNNLQAFQFRFKSYLNETNERFFNFSWQTILAVPIFYFYSRADCRQFFLETDFSGQDIINQTTEASVRQLSPSSSRILKTVWQPEKGDRQLACLQFE